MFHLMPCRLALETDIMMNAQQYNAFAVQLEHRFYGETHPLPDLSMQSLQYLNTDQVHFLMLLD